MSQVHLVLADEPYETSVVIRAFANEALAEEFAQKLRGYQLTQPEWPMTDEPDEVFAQKNKSIEDWRAAHPGGEDAAWHRFFSVIHVPFAAEQPDTVKVPRELLERLVDVCADAGAGGARKELCALLGKESEDHE